MKHDRIRVIRKRAMEPMGGNELGRPSCLSRKLEIDTGVNSMHSLTRAGVARGGCQSP